MVLKSGTDFPFSVQFSLLSSVWVPRTLPAGLGDLSAVHGSVSCVPGHSASPTGMEERWALGFGSRGLGKGPWEGVLWMACLLRLPWSPQRHQAWVRSTCSVTWGHTVSSPGDLDYREVKVK